MDFDEKNLARGGTTLEERKECIRRLFDRSKREVVHIEDCLLALVEGNQTLLDGVRSKLQSIDMGMNRYYEQLDAAVSEEEQERIVREVVLPSQDAEVSNEPA